MAPAGKRRRRRQLVLAASTSSIAGHRRPCVNPCRPGPAPRVPTSCRHDHHACMHVHEGAASYCSCMSSCMSWRAGSPPGCPCRASARQWSPCRGRRRRSTRCRRAPRSPAPPACGLGGGAQRGRGRRGHRSVTLDHAGPPHPYCAAPCFAVLRPGRRLQGAAIRSSSLWPGWNRQPRSAVAEGRQQQQGMRPGPSPAEVESMNP